MGAVDNTCKCTRQVVIQQGREGVRGCLAPILEVAREVLLEELPFDQRLTEMREEIVQRPGGSMTQGERAARAQAMGQV